MPCGVRHMSTDSMGADVRPNTDSYATARAQIFAAKASEIAPAPQSAPPAGYGSGAGTLSETVDLIVLLATAAATGLAPHVAPSVSEPFAGASTGEPVRLLTDSTDLIGAAPVSPDEAAEEAAWTAFSEGAR